MIRGRSNLWRLSMMMALAFTLIWPAAAAAIAQEDADADTMLQDAAESMLALESFHFSVTTPVGTTSITDQVELSGIEGDVLRPDRFRAEFTVSLGFVELTLNAIGIGSNLWVTDPTAGADSYIRVGGDGDENLPPLALLNPDRLVLLAVNLLHDPTITGDDQIDDVSVTTIEGTFDPSDLSSLGTPVPEGLLATNEPLAVNLWIDSENRIVRAEFAGPLLAAEQGAGRIVRRIDLSAFNDPVDIEAPEAQA